MNSRITFFGHPVHQQLVQFPVGLLVGAFVFDVLHLVTGSPEMATVAYWTMAAGVVAGLVAAPFGLMDLMALPAGSRAARIGRLHGGGNAVVLALFAGSWLLRDGAAPPWPAVALSTLGVALLVLTGWLGGELVSRLGVGVSERAGVDAPSSLDGERAPDAEPARPARR